MRLRVSFEERILGTGGGIARAAAWLDTDPVVVMNADLLFRPDLEAALETHARGRFLATLICVRDPLHAQLALDGARVASIHPRPVFGDPELWAFTGVYLLAQDAVGRLAAAAGPGAGSPFLDIVPEFRAWMAEGRLGAFRSTALFRDTGNPEAYLDLLRDVEGPFRRRLLGPEEELPAPVLMGAPSGTQECAHAAFIPDRFAFRRETLAWISSDTQVPGTARIEESAILRGAEIGPDTSIVRCLIGPGAVVSGAVERLAAADGLAHPLALASREQEEIIRAFVARAGSGTEAFGAAGAAAEGASRFAVRRLQGDGSTRAIYRIIAEDETRIVVRAPEPPPGDVYPKRTGPGIPNETETFVYVGGYLRSLGVHTPRIDAAVPEAGLLLQEDLGDTLLYHLLQKDTPEAQIRSLYREAVETLARMQSAGPAPFDPLQTHNLPYDLPFVLRFEAGYFHREMVQDHCGIRIPFEELRGAYERAAQEALDGPLTFMHRDYQSRNLLIAPRGLVVIDFQGARVGPPEYDLAALLLDPYSDPGEILAEEMIAAYARLRPAEATPGDLEAVRRRFRACAVNRLMQALGAFGYLGGKLGKPGFLPFAPTAARRLRAVAGAEHPEIAALAGQVLASLEERSGP